MGWLKKLLVVGYRTTICLLYTANLVKLELLQYWAWNQRRVMKTNRYVSRRTKKSSQISSRTSSQMLKTFNNILLSHYRLFISHVDSVIFNPDAQYLLFDDTINWLHSATDKKGCVWIACSLRPQFCVRAWQNIDLASIKKYFDRASVYA